MADIKQAALWMDEGKRVRQGSLDQNGWFESNSGWVIYRTKWDALPNQFGWLFTTDLLADNWEIFE